MKYQPKKKSAGLNLAPMIDIVFLLLIFFLVSSTLQGEEAIYNITVPDSNLGQSTAKEKINIFLDKNNKIYYQEKKYSRNNISALIKKLKVSNLKSIKIYADQKSEFQAVVFLIEKFKNNGFEKISFSLREKN